MAVSQARVTNTVITNTIKIFLLKKPAVETIVPSVKKKFDYILLEISNFFNKGEKRSIAAKKNIVGSFLIKAINMATALVLVPLTIHYINPTQYGIWLTLTSMVGWASLFDVGLTQGLRNKFAEAKAVGDTELARIYVSTTYFYVALIFGALWIVLVALSQVVNWASMINIPVEMEGEIVSLVIIIISYFCLQFVFQVVKTVIISDQKPAIASLVEMLGQISALFIIWLLTKYTEGSLIYLGFGIGVTPVLILILANIYFFKGEYYQYRPSLKFVRKEYASKLMGIGGKFFVLQLAAMIQYSSSLFLIAHFFDPDSVTSYNIAFKYFVALQSIFMIFLTPLWSSTTEAYFVKDFGWIVRIVKKYVYLFIPFLFTAIVMVLFADEVYELWLGEGLVVVDPKITLFCFISTVLAMFSSIFVNVVNGMGTLKIQFISSIFTSLLFIAMAIVFVEYLGLGVWSIILASILSNVYGYLISPVQVYQVVVKKSKNRIWY